MQNLNIDEGCWPRKYPFETKLLLEASELVSLAPYHENFIKFTSDALNRYIIPFCEIEWEAGFIDAIEELRADPRQLITPDINYYLTTVSDTVPALSAMLRSLELKFYKAWWFSVRVFMERLAAYWSILHFHRIAFQTYGVQFKIKREPNETFHVYPYVNVTILTEQAVHPQQMLPATL